MWTQILQYNRCVPISIFSLRMLKLNRLITKHISNSRCMNTLAPITYNEQKLLHTAVLTNEVIEALNPQNNQVIIDMTFGAGGHTKAILQAAPKCQVLCLDRDPASFTIAKNLSNKNPQVTPLHGKFSDIHKIVDSHGFGNNSIDAVLFDCGASSMQYDSVERGFGLSQDMLLDMRMDGNSIPNQPSAADIVNNISEEGLYRIIKKYGEEKKARLIARAIVDTRYAFGKIQTTKQLSNIVASVYQMSYSQDKLARPSHVATKTFQALRIFVNNELNELYNGLEIAWHLLKPTGVCAAISFHSLEDRIIKRQFHGIDIDKKFNMSVGDQVRSSGKVHSMETLETVLHKRWEAINKRVILPSSSEQEANPRSRSAKLRVAKKVPIL